MLLDQNYIKNYLVPQHLKKEEENTFSMWTPTHLEKLCTILSNFNTFSPRSASVGLSDEAK